MRFIQFVMRDSRIEHLTHVKCKLNIFFNQLNLINMMMMMLDHIFQVQDHLLLSYQQHKTDRQEKKKRHHQQVSMLKESGLVCLQCKNKWIFFVSDKIKSYEIRRAKQNHEAIGRFYKMASCNIFSVLFSIYFIRSQCYWISFVEYFSHHKLTERK